MKRFKLIVMTALGALAVSAIAASGAQADSYACTVAGAAGPIDPGVQALANDAGEDTGDGVLTNVPGFPSDVLSDTDAGNGDQEGGGEDGTYEFHSDPGGVTCAYVDDQNSANNGVYDAAIDSFGEYNNYVCGTGWAVADDADQDTTVTLTDTPTMNGSDITDADYRIDFADGAGVLNIRSAENDQGESGIGAGVINIEPQVGNCVTTDVTEFAVNGSFSGTTSP